MIYKSTTTKWRPMLLSVGRRVIRDIPFEKITYKVIYFNIDHDFQTSIPEISFVGYILRWSKPVVELCTYRTSILIL